MHGINILAIEDYLPDIIQVKEYLKEGNLKYTFFHKTSLKEGILVTQSQDIDIVLLDLSLDDTTGFATLTHFLKEVPNIPVVVMTGTPSKDLGERAVREGAQDYLIKGDWDTRTIVKSIIFSLHRWKAKNKIQEEAKKLKVDVTNMGKILTIARLGQWKMNLVNNSMTWDAEMFDIFGQPNSSFQPNFSDYINFVHPEDKDSVNQFFQNVTKGNEKLEIIHRIVIEHSKIKKVLVRAGVEHNQIDDEVYVIGSVQDMTHSNEIFTPVDRHIQQLRANPLLQSLHKDFYHPTDIEPFVNWCEFCQQGKANFPKDILLPLIKEGAHKGYQELIFQLLMKPEALNFQEHSKYELKAFQRLLIPFQLGCFPGVEIQIAENFPEQIHFNQLLTFYILYSIHLTINTQGDAHSGAVLKIDFLQNELQKSYLTFTLTGKLNGVLIENGDLKDLIDPSPATPINKKALWVRFTLFKLIEIGNGEILIHQNTASIKDELTIKIPAHSATIKPTEGKKTKEDLRVLVVDDRYLNRLNLKTKLETSFGRSMIIAEAENGKEAVKIVDKQNIDMVIMDSHMPIMGGIEASSMIKQKNQEIPIIMIYHELNPEEEKSCKNIGIDEFIQKPLNQEKLKALITIIQSNQGDSIN